MALLTSSSRRSSTSSFRSTALYSSSYAAEDSTLDPPFGTSLDSADHPSLFPDDGPGGPKCSSPYSWHNRSSLGNSVPPSTDLSSTGGGSIGQSDEVSAEATNISSRALVASPIRGGVSLGSPVMGHPASSSSSSGMGGGGGVRCLGDLYLVAVDVRQFEPQDVVVMAYHQHIVIQAAKVLDDGRVGDTFTHKSLLPTDMDPLSVSGSFGSDGVLVVSVQRNRSVQMEPPGPRSPQ